MSLVFSPVSFLLVTYNQEKYIRAAFESALRQEGFPIEIIVTDDHSTDRTFEIVKQMTQEYMGPHKIILNRNAKNLGIVSQLNRAISLSTGEFIVGMAGDDISLPNRARRSYEEWCNSEKKAHSIFFNAELIDSTGIIQNIKYIKQWKNLKSGGLSLQHYNQSWWTISPAKNPRSIYNNWVLGATHAFSRKTFSTFGLLEKFLLVEDHAIPFRAGLLGNIRFVDEVVLLYRRHENNWTKEQKSKKDNAKKEQIETLCKIYTCFQAVIDLKSIKKNKKYVLKANEKIIENLYKLAKKYPICFLYNILMIVLRIKLILFSRIFWYALYKKTIRHVKRY